MIPLSPYTYDLHIHSCLSPCGDDESTPASVAGMAALNGLAVAALTDHNSSKNCPAFCRAAAHYGVIPVPGMELTTCEEVHLVCLFPSLEAAMDFDRFVEAHRVPIRNKPALFGRQLIMDEDDNVLGEEENLLINATDLSLREGFEACLERGGAAYPAHIDRPSGGVIGVLGTFPEDIPFAAYEVNDPESIPSLTERFPVLRGLVPVISSDAHSLTALPEGGYTVLLDDEPYSSALVRERLIARLSGKETRRG